jgi:hypothetical protein
MGTRIKVFATLALAGACGVLALPSMAGAATRSGVTIHHYQGSSLEGFVFSPKPRQCANARTVKLFRQTGKKQNPKRDTKLAKTSSYRNSGGHYKWQMHLRPGKLYARVPATPACQADNSRTINVSGPPNTTLEILDKNVNKGRVVFHYRGVGGVPPYHFECKLDNRGYQHCPDNSKSYTGLSRGHHVFKVRAIGANGKKDPTPAKRKFRM